MEIYNHDGMNVHGKGIRPDISLTYKRDENSGCFYSLIIIPQTRTDGTKQYPFVKWPNYPNGGNKSALETNQGVNFKYDVIINGGTFRSPAGAGVTLSGLPVGTVIENGVVLSQGTESSDTEWVKNNQMVLTINDAGELGYASFLTSADDLVSNGIVSAVTGFIPIVTNFVNADDVIEDEMPYMEAEADSPRQVIGQFGNGDYAIITCSGRGDQGSIGFTVRQLQTLCKNFGLKEAFILDGGGSTETVLGHRQINTIYDNTYGRVVPTFIVFNGTTEFN